MFDSSHKTWTRRARLGIWESNNMTSNMLRFLCFRDNLLELRIYYESLTFSDVKQVPSYDLYSLLGK